MEISQFGFVLLAVYSFCFGAILGALYDIMRITRILLGAERGTDEHRAHLRGIKLPIINKSAYPKKRTRVVDSLLNVYTAIGDIAFVAMSGMIVVMIAYAYNNGRIRMVIFIGLLSGFLLYYYGVGKLTMKVSELVAFAIRSAAVYIFTAIRFVVRKILKMLKIKKKGAKKDAKHKRKSKNAVSA